MKISADMIKLSDTDARNVYAPEALHRKLGFKMQKKSYAVKRMHFYLPDFKIVTFNASNKRRALKAAQNRLSTLTVYFVGTKFYGEFETQHG